MNEVEKSWATRKLGAESSTTRSALVDAAHRLFLDEGYAAVTSRRVAREAGLKPQLVHYYFRSMDDLYLEVLRRDADEALEQLNLVLDSEQPLQALWEFVGDARTARFTTEFTALASRNSVIRAELARHGETFRRLQTEAISRHLAARGIEPKLPPVVVSILLVSVSLILEREKALGMTLGHAELEAVVEHTMRSFQETGDAPPGLFPTVS